MIYYIPEEYISDSSQKVDIYRRITRISSAEQLSDLQDEIMDRYGELPPPVERLLMSGQN